MSRLHGIPENPRKSQNSEKTAPPHSPTMVRGAGPFFCLFGQVVLQVTVRPVLVSRARPCRNNRASGTSPTASTTSSSTSTGTSAHGGPSTRCSQIRACGRLMMTCSAHSNSSTPDCCQYRAWTDRRRRLSYINRSLTEAAVLGAYPDCLDTVWTRKNANHGQNR